MLASDQRAYRDSVRAIPLKTIDVPFPAEPTLTAEKRSLRFKDIKTPNPASWAIQQNAPTLTANQPLNRKQKYTRVERRTIQTLPAQLRHSVRVAPYSAEHHPLH
jgi:hypothetical protein